jgi:hypothetical protein
MPEVSGVRVDAPYTENYYVIAKGLFGVNVRGLYLSRAEAERVRDRARRDYREDGTAGVRLGIVKRSQGRR